MVIRVTLNRKEIEELLLAEARRRVWSSDEVVGGLELGEFVPGQVTITFRTQEKEPQALPLAPVHETPRVKDQDEIRSEMEAISPDDLPF